LINPPVIAWGKHIVAFVFLLLEMFLVTAVAVFFSSFASNGLVSFFFSLVLYFMGCNLNNVKLILESKIGENISPALKGIFSFAYWILPNISLLDLKSWAVHDMTLPVADLALRFSYGIFFIAALLFLASAIFSRRELS
jgi:ABC-type transport system involved in multi-copper enzyme maturation permease subunit